MNIKDLRKSRGITQKFLANELGVTRQWFAKLETGDKEMSKLQKEKLAKILNLPIEVFKKGGIVDVWYRKRVQSKIFEFFGEEKWKINLIKQILREYTKVY